MNNIKEEISRRMQLLEEKFEYQDQTIETLNDVIIEQQNQINALEENLAKLQTILSTDMVQGEKDDPLPPHY